jgi:mono/diheme cytochrome c family protein
MSRSCSFLGPLLLLSACATAPEPKWKDGDPKVGHEVARDLCSSCHAIERTGDSPHPGAPPFRGVLESYRPDWLAEDLHNSVAIAHARMPTFYFGEDHEYDVVAYLLTIQEKPPRPGHPD